jgi:hypothetical protein
VPKDSTYSVERKVQRSSKDAVNMNKEAGTPDFYPTHATRNPPTKDLKQMSYKHNANPEHPSLQDPPEMSSHGGGMPCPFDNDWQYPGAYSEGHHRAYYDVESNTSKNQDSSNESSTAPCEEPLIEAYIVRDKS